MENKKLYGKDSKSEVNVMLDNELELLPSVFKIRANEHFSEYLTHI